MRGAKGGNIFPFFFTMFTFILVGNMLGMIPGSFTFTSHIIVTFTMAMFVVVSVTIIAFAKHGMHFFSFFVPKGRAGSGAAASGADRGAVLPDPPGQPFPSVCS